MTRPRSSRPRTGAIRTASFDHALANRVRALLHSKGEVAEKRMFGGLSFLLGGHMCTGVDRTDLIVRVHPEQHAMYLARPGAREFDLGRRGSMAGWLLISRDATRTTASLESWIDACVSHAASLPPKPQRIAKSRRTAQ